MRARILGQPLNPMLTVLPLGILGSAVLVDLAALISGGHLFGRLAHADMMVGLLTGAAALCTVLIDLITAAVGSMARQVLSVVAAFTGSMIAVFMVIWSVRTGGNQGPNGFAFLAELLALAAGVFGAVLIRRLTLGLGLPNRYLAVGAGTYRLLVDATGWAADALRRTVPLIRLPR